MLVSTCVWDKDPAGSAYSTYSIPMMAEGGNNWAKTALLNAFRAARILRYHIQEDTKKFCTAKEESLPILENLPYVKEVPTYSPESVESASPSVICLHVQM
jgi:hypothetical protein